MSIPLLSDAIVKSHISFWMDVFTMSHWQKFSLHSSPLSTGAKERTLFNG
jgi:hypothetical protein